MIRTLVFSKDRACQLDLLLTSLRTFVPGLREELSVAVLYRASSAEFARGYDRLRTLHPWPEYHEERSFRADVLQLLATPAPHLMFLVDDLVFIRPWDPASVAILDRQPDTLCLSLRLHPGINYSYPPNCPAPPPPLLAGRWRWRGQPGCWGYPMSLDAHVYRRRDLDPIFKRISFTQPNALESALKAAAPALPYMACHDAPIVINLPQNVVRGDGWPSRHQGLSAEELNTRFLGNSRLSLQHLQNLTPASAHVEAPLVFSPPTAVPVV
jgi:hypothetical protein